MAGQSSKGKKIGRDKIKCAAYRAHLTKEKHAVKRVLKSSGLKAAQQYAAKHGVKVPVLKMRVGRLKRLAATVVERLFPDVILDN